ncbi:MAG: PaaI family thioesterase [Actinomycetes bacterium]
MTSLPAGMSIQEFFFPTMNCFGCGPANRLGLRLRSFPSDGGTIAEFTPWPEHDNGLGFLNGGIICTVLDCHSATPMFLEADRLGVLDLSKALPYVTAGLDVRYLRPTPLAATLQLRAEAIKVDSSAVTVTVEVSSDGKVTATATALWKRWRPRQPTAP